MNKQSYETPVMTEFELLSEQTFLQTSAGATTESYSEQTTYGGDTGNGIWK